MRLSSFGRVRGRRPDAGKAAHHCTVIDAEAARVLSCQVANNEAELLELLGGTLEPADGDPATGAVGASGPREKKVLKTSRPHACPMPPQRARGPHTRPLNLRGRRIPPARRSDMSVSKPVTART